MSKENWILLLFILLLLGIPLTESRFYVFLGTDILNEYRRNIARSRFVKSLRKGADSIAKFVVDKLSN